MGGGTVPVAGAAPLFVYNGQSLELEILPLVQGASIPSPLPGALEAVPLPKTEALLWLLLHSSLKGLLPSFPRAPHGPGLPGKPLLYDPLPPRLVPTPPQGAITLGGKWLCWSLKGVAEPC